MSNNASFEFRTVPHIISETGCAERLGALLAEYFDSRRALVVTDKGLVDAGVVAPVLASLEAVGFTVTVFDKVLADPPEALAHEAVALVKDKDIGLVIGLGGGSSMDVAKIVAVLAVSDQPRADM